MSSGNKRYADDEVELDGLWPRRKEPGCVAPEEAKRPSRICTAIEVFPRGTQAAGGRQKSMEVVGRYDRRNPPHPRELETGPERVKHFPVRIRPCANREVVDGEIDRADHSTESSARHEKGSASH